MSSPGKPSVRPAAPLEVKRAYLPTPPVRPRTPARRKDGGTVNCIYQNICYNIPSHQPAKRTFCLHQPAKRSLAECTTRNLDVLRPASPTQRLDASLVDKVPIFKVGARADYVLVASRRRRQLQVPSQGDKDKLPHCPSYGMD